VGVTLGLYVQVVGWFCCPLLEAPIGDESGTTTSSGRPAVVVNRTEEQERESSFSGAIFRAAIDYAFRK
jgi:hypothetical protein